jgi:thiol-disulfide isomerase/thioredoxin
MKSLSKAFWSGALLITVFCVSFFFLYQRARSNAVKEPLILTSAVINRPLPKANLVNFSGSFLDDEKLRRGKVLVLFTMTDCEPCDQENDFLKQVVSKRKDIPFIYIIPFGNKDEALKSAQSKYAFETYFDEGSQLARTLDIYTVPIKVFLEDGIIKKTWVGATVENQQRAEFENWLTQL